MTRIHIPQNRQSAFIAISNFSDAVTKELFAILANVSPAQYGPDLPHALAGSLTSVKPEEAEQVIDTLFSIYALIISSTKSANEVIEEILASLVDECLGEINFESEQLEQLRRNLQKLLTVPSIGLGAKATSVLFDNERNFMTSRILTDIRPIFQMESTDIGGAVVIHTLKLEYADSSDGSKEFFLVLDSDDLDSMISTLLRAQEKAQKIKAMLAASSVPLIYGSEI